MGIFVKDSGLKVAFSKEEVSGYVEYAGADEQAFAELLKAIAADSPKHAYMQQVWEQNGKLRVKSSNKFAADLRATAKLTLDEQGQVSEPTIEQIMAEAEAENARRDALQPNPQRLQALATELAKYGMQIAS